jgi:glutamate-1-semialdehyde aminotransferase
MPAFGKTIAGGFPIGVTSGRAEVMEVFDPGTRGARRITTGGIRSASPGDHHRGLATMRAMRSAELHGLDGRGARPREEIAAAAERALGVVARR